jgi:hypothetical protein
MDVRREHNRRLGKNHDHELHNLNSLPKTTTVIQQKSVRWAGYVAGMEEKCMQGFDGKT